MKKLNKILIGFLSGFSTVGVFYILFGNLLGLPMLKPIPMLFLCLIILLCCFIVYYDIKKPAQN